MKSVISKAIGMAAVACCLMAAWAARDAAVPEMKFNDVREIAPGVFFRYSSISATDPSVPFGGCNNTWVVFKEFVVVIDANFPKEAEDVIAASKKTTDKPIRYVFDTHHHGDHAYGNTVWAKAGAKVIGHVNCSRLLEMNGPKQWAEAARDRKDIANNKLKTVDIPFDEKHVIDDGVQRVEFLYFGHAHTPGDAVAYLPRHKLLCTGDACVNGAFNFMGHSNSASWIKVLDRMKDLDVAMIAPGHGKVTTKDLLDKQQRYFVDMRAAVKKGIEDKKTLAESTETIGMPWYKEWTGKDASKIPDNVGHVYKELTGKIDHSMLGRANTPDAMGPHGPSRGVDVAGK